MSIQFIAVRCTQSFALALHATHLIIDRMVIIFTFFSTSDIKNNSFDILELLCV